MRLRQVALVAADLAAAEATLIGDLGLGEPFRDPGVGDFGLHNAVWAVGDTFLEVVSPVREGTTAGRYLERRGGDGGYMVIVQVDDLAAARAWADELGIRRVWDVDLDDIAASHLHPADVGGAILSLDQPRPPGSWRWAGPDWEHRAASEASEIAGVEVQADDPAKLASRWAEVLDRPVDDEGVLRLDRGLIRFVQATDGRGDGVSAVDVAGHAGYRPPVEACGITLRWP